MTIMVAKKGVYQEIRHYACTPSGDPIDLSGGSITIHVKDSNESSEALIVKFINQFDDPESGLFHVPITPLDTSDLPIRTPGAFGKYYRFFMEIIDYMGARHYSEGFFYLEPTGISNDAPMVNLSTGDPYSTMYLYAGEHLSFSYDVVDDNGDPVDIDGGGWNIVFEMKRWWDFDSSIIYKDNSDGSISVSNVNQVDFLVSPEESVNLVNHYCFTVYAYRSGERIVVDAGYIYIRRSA
ncbi:MAG: hypothetical protein SVK08_01640 [Halobacteriota archaeon]|nr:hypothetical protein [Halobacteriota archaeon]